MSLDQKQLANAIRFLSMDAVQKAKSGHPGMPMGMADIATVLWRNYLQHNPKNPNWMNRDRFILSNGHGSMLLYSLLHLSGYGLTIDDLKNFRQLHAKTPGHPEYGYAPGVETTTGPLGQGLANAVGMALAEKVLSSTFNQSDIELIDHYTYVFIGDGCLMEGVSHEVSSLAGTLKLGKLIAFWDDNNISIDGDTSGWFTENVAKRYEAYGWHVIQNVDGHDTVQVDQAIAKARALTDKPTLICCKTKIGFGSPNKVGTHGVHGAPLGDDEIAKTREALNWPYKPFEISKEIYQAWDHCQKGQADEQSWLYKWQAYQEAYPQKAKELLRRLDNKRPQDFNEVIEKYLQSLLQDKPKVATRKASQMALEQICAMMPEMFGGSADLTGSNLTNWSGSKWLNAHEVPANYLSYGVREFGMAAMMNGMSLYGGFKPYGGTFLVFSDYARNAIRMSAIMKQPVVYVMTHDSIGLGEDGPTHQPIEHLPSLRVMPNLYVWRPADSVETAIAWQCALQENHAPSVLALSRQGLPTIVDDDEKVQAIKKGGYVLQRAKNPVLTMIGTGSEVSILCEAAKILLKEGIAVNVVSMPCVEKFLMQKTSYKAGVVPQDIPVLVMEAAQPDLWYRLLPKAGGEIIGMTGFGESAPADQLYQYFGLTVENAVAKAKKLLCVTEENQVVV
ncbi:transketolase [Facilibium subflavum]|uniref:transketolase n=1 Tax=Facilibium subflavum TaxID=2219058 RepID=UPI000E6481AE|nr:transketolase [Facilibium subflavum]